MRRDYQSNSCEEDEEMVQNSQEKFRNSDCDLTNLLLYSEENHFTYFEDSTVFQNFIDQFTESTLIFMLSHQKKLCKELEFLYENWFIINPGFPELQNLIKKFIDIVYAKLDHFPYWYFIYPRLWKIIKKYQLFLSYKGDQKNVSYIEANNTDMIFYHACCELKNKSKQNYQYKITEGQGDTLKPLNYFISQNRFFQGNYQWESLYKKMYIFIKQENDFLQKESQKQNINDQLFQKHPINIGNLMQAPFFYEKINISNSLSNDCFLGLAGSVKKLQDAQCKQKIQVEVVGMLNHEGGMVLFDCKQAYFDVLPVGYMIQEGQQIVIKTGIQNILSQVDPHITIGIEYDIDFIPLAVPKISKTDGPLFLHNTYVTVIKIHAQPRLKLYQIKSKRFFKYKSILFPQYVCVLSQQTDQFQYKLFNVLKQGHIQAMNQQRILAKKVNETWNSKLSYPCYFYAGVQNEENIKLEQVNPDQIEKILFYPLPIEDQHYSRYVSLILPLTYKYQKILSDSFSSQSKAFDPTVEQAFIYKQLPGYEQLSLRYHSLSCKINHQKYNLFKYRIMKGKKYGSILLALQFVHTLISKNREKIQNLAQNYNKDLMQLKTENHCKSSLLSSYNQKIAIFAEECAILEEYFYIVKKIWEKKFLMIKYPFKYRKAINKITIDNETPKEPIQEIHYFSVMLSKPQNIEQIKQNFKNHKIDCEIISFKHKQLRKASFIFMVKHRISHKQLRQIIEENKEDFIFDNKKISIAPLTNYIHLIKRNTVNPMGQQDLKQISRWLKSQYPNQTLRMWSYQRPAGSIEHYISTESELSTIFMYLVLENYGEKVAFKNPEQFLQRNQHNNRMTLLYPIQH